MVASSSTPFLKLPLRILALIMSSMEPEQVYLSLHNYVSTLAMTYNLLHFTYSSTLIQNVCHMYETVTYLLIARYAGRHAGQRQ